MNLFKDEYGLTDTGIVALGVAVIVIVTGLILTIAYLAWPKDSHGNPLPCVSSHQEQTLVPIIVGKVTYFQPETITVCDQYASPSPG